MKKQYHITLRDGEQKQITILKKPVYQCYLFGDASQHYLTQEEIKSRVLDIDGRRLSNTDPFTLMQKYVGYLRDEGAMFDVYRGLRNPIVKLELIETEE